MKQIFILMVFILSLSASDSKNRLQYETSPYLKQHENNPINWYPWGDEAFERAKKENKAVFLSIGYSTCHWCHVMAKESFENEEIAKVFNNYFISIKVDREEMPHLDSFYQELHLKLKGRSGGWPLSAFLTANREPFYVATYIPSLKKSYHEGLDTLLPRLAREYRDTQMILKRVNAVKLKINQPLKLLQSKDANISLKTLSDSIENSYDDIYSGFGRSKKFPEASKIALMLDVAELSRGSDLENQAYEMLDTMALRGLYDHVEGGFFRYCVDAAWEIPHFEKMLYNQAELIPLYVRAYKNTHKELYRSVVVETIAMLDKRFVKNELYFSASDADTHHEEGDFFLYTPTEIQKALKNNRYKKEILEALDYTAKGNFEGRVHLNFFSENRPKGFNEFRAKLLLKRDSSEYPFIDKKIITAWNAMMIEALYRASDIDIKYAKKADRHLKALQEFMFEKGELYHQSLFFKKPTQKGLLEDYSFFISALLAGYSVDYDKKKLDFAEYLLSVAKRNFYKNGSWYLSNDNLNIQAGLKDKYYTSALAKMTQNIIKLAALKDSFVYEELALASLDSLNARLEEKQVEAPASAIAYLMQYMGVVVLKNSQKRLKEEREKIAQISYPYLLSKVAKTNAKEEYLACTMQSCFAIDRELSKIKKSIESRRR